MNRSQHWNLHSFLIVNAAVVVNFRNRLFCELHLNVFSRRKVFYFHFHGKRSLVNLESLIISEEMPDTLKKFENTLRKHAIILLDYETRNKLDQDGHSG